MRWYVSTLGEFYNCEEDTVVYFDPSSGDTHLLNQFAAHLIGLLSYKSLDIEQLTEQISQDIDQPDLPELRLAIPNVLDELVALDIIQQL
jgi:PqqD family protein of HPr-rel-A system